MTQRIFHCVPELSKLGRMISQTANLMCGMPDYATYVEHRKAQHPEEPIMSHEDFFRDRQQARYGEGGSRGFRCC